MKQYALPHVEIVSSPAPCGVTYLLNILLEMNIKIYAGSESLFWNKADATQSVNPLLRNKFGLWIPSLHKTSFNFADLEPAVEWGHTWPYSQCLNTKRIIFVRDPRDALYSEWKRKKLTITYSEFIADRIPPLEISRLDTFVLFYHLWIALSQNNDQTLLIRFEDIKSDPLLWTKKTLTFLSIDRTPEDIVQAITASETGRVRQHFQNILTQAGLTKHSEVVIRKGEPFEWKTDPDRRQMSAFETPFVTRFLREMSYEITNETPISSRAPIQATIDKVINSLYGKHSYWLALADRPAVAKVISDFLELTSQVPQATIIPYCLNRRARILVFSIVVRCLSILHNLGQKLYPPLSRMIEKQTLAYPLGQ